MMLYKNLKAIVYLPDVSPCKTIGTLTKKLMSPSGKQTIDFMFLRWTFFIEYQLQLPDDTGRLLMKQWVPDRESSRATTDQHQVVKSIDWAAHWQWCGVLWEHIKKIGKMLRCSSALLMNLLSGRKWYRRKIPLHHQVHCHQKAVFHEGGSVLL